MPTKFLPPMIDRNIKDQIIPYIGNDVFYDQEHKNIFRAMKDLFILNSPIDHATVYQQMKANESLSDKTKWYIIEVSDTVASSANAEYHSKILIEMWMRRELTDMSHRFASLAIDQSQDIFDIMRSCQDEIMGLSQYIQIGKSKSVSDFVDIVYDNAMKAKNNPGTLIGIPSGYIPLLVCPPIISKVFSAPALSTVAKEF